MRQIQTRLALTLAALLLSAGLVQAADAVFPRGSAFGLVPPEGMVESTGFAGFEDRAKSASILIVEMPGSAYAQVEAGFTDAALASKGIIVDQRGNLPIADAKTLFVTGRQSAGTVMAKKWILLVGKPEATALVTVQVPEANADALPDDKVREILQSLAYRAPPTAQEQMSGLPFHLKDLSGFRPVKVIGNTAVVLTDGPKDIVENAEQAVFVAGIAPGAPRDDERRQFAMRALGSVPSVKEMRIERAEPLRINGQAGFEILAVAKDAISNADVKVVQWLRFGTTAHLRMIAIVKAEDFAAEYPRLRTIRDGVETN